MHWNNARIFTVTAINNRLQRTKIKTTLSGLHIFTMTGETLFTKQRRNVSRKQQRTFIVFRRNCYSCENKKPEPKDRSMKQEHVYETSVITPHEQELQCSQICVAKSATRAPGLQCYYFGDFAALTHESGTPVSPRKIRSTGGLAPSALSVETGSCSL
jgi:hypothetical protein